MDPAEAGWLHRGGCRYRPWLEAWSKRLDDVVPGWTYWSPWCRSTFCDREPGACSVWVTIATSSPLHGDPLLLWKVGEEGMTHPVGLMYPGKVRCADLKHLYMQAV